MSSPTVRLSLGVKLGSALIPPGDCRADWQEAFRSGLLAEADALAADLALPVRFDLGPIETPSSKCGAESTVGVSLSGQECRLPLDPPPPTGAVELARWIASAIARNREMLVTAPVVAAFQARLPRGHPGAGREPAFLLPAVATLVRHAARATRLTELPAAVWTEVRSSDELTRRAASGTRFLRLGLSMGSLESKTDSGELSGLTEQLRDGMYYELGVPMPIVAIEHDPRLAAGEFRLRINDLRLPVRKGPGLSGFLANETPLRLAQLGVQADPATNPVNGRVAALVRDGEPALAKCREAGIFTWGTHEYAMLSLAGEIYHNAPWLLTTELVEHSLWILKRRFPDLVDALRHRFPTEGITEILRGLVAEGVSIRNLRAILEGLLAIDGVCRPGAGRLVVLPSSGNLAPSANATCVEELGIADWINVARMALRRQITHQVAPDGTLRAYLLEAAAKERLSRAPAEPLSRSERTGLLKAIADVPRGEPIPVILTDVVTRSTLNELIRHEFPAIRVLSYLELTPTVQLEPLARIAWVPIGEAARGGAEEGVVAELNSVGGGGPSGDRQA